MSDLVEEVFDTLEPQRRRVRLAGVEYLVQEASEGAACQYRSASMRGSELTQGSDGKVSIKRLDEVSQVEPLLVSLCLYRTDANTPGGMLPVALATVLGWKSSVVRRLYEIIRELSPGLDEKETEETLRRRLTDTQRKLDAVLKTKARQAGGGAADPTVPSPSVTTGTSG